MCVKTNNKKEKRMSSKPKFVNGQRATPLFSITPCVLSQTATDKQEQYIDAIENIKKFHAKWNELRFPACGERDDAKVANYEERVKDYVESARTAKQDAARFASVDPRVKECLNRIRQYQ